MRNKILGKLCLCALASGFMLCSTLKYAMADYLMNDGCVHFPTCTGTGFQNYGECSTVQCRSVDCLSEPGQDTIFQATSYVYRNTATGLQCKGNFKSPYSSTGGCCPPG